MASEIRLPELGENVEGGDVVDVAVNVGDTVSNGQTLLEVEAGKSTVPVPAQVAGRISEVLVKKGDNIKTGHLLFRIEAGDGARAPAPSKPAKPPEEASKAAAPPKQPATAPPSVAPAAPAAPPRDNGVASAPAVAPAASPQTSAKLVPASPATRLLARQLGVDLGQVRGSASHGRVTQEDVKAFVRQQMSAGPARGPVATLPAPALPDFTRFGPIERKPMNNIRRETARRMTLAWTQVPHVTQHDLADITDLEAFRRQQGGKGPKLTVTAFVLKGAAIALRQFPQFAASIDLAGGQLVYKQYYHIGVAVDTERGLVVPVLRDVDKKSVHMLAQELSDVAERARQGKLRPEDMEGGTFTITNLGGIGGTGFTPIVNWPEVAILGLSRGSLQPVIKDGQVLPRLMLPLSLSYDHRLIDGADAARFTRRLAEMLENPLVMLLDA